MEYEDTQKLIINKSTTGISSIIGVNVSTLIDTQQDKTCKHMLCFPICSFGVFVAHTSLLGVILKCPWELISIAYDVCFNGLLNGYSIAINLKI